MIFCEYETTNRRLFLSLKRAKNILSLEHEPACSVEAFFDYLSEKYPDIPKYIEFITFYNFDYSDKTENFKYNIAYIYTVPSLKFRDSFFKEREKITHDTGWYPYITGSRANFTHFTAEKSYKYWKIEKNKIPYVHLGKPLSIKNVASDFYATAMLLQCEKGNVLLDTGFGIEELYIEMIDFIFISHFHYDHTGGVIQILQKKDIAVIMSSITLDYMLNLDSICEEDKKRLLKNAVIADSLNDRSYIVTTLEFFDSYHCPGSIGIKYKFNDFDIIYAGDICLKNGFYDYRTDFDKIIANNNRKKYVLLDAALVKKSELSTGEENYSDLSDEIFNSVDNEKILFVSKGTEMLFNIYIKLFAQSVLCSKETNFVVSDELYKILKNVLRSWFISKYGCE